MGEMRYSLNAGIMVYISRQSFLEVLHTAVRMKSDTNSCVMNEKGYSEKLKTSLLSHLRTASEVKWE